MSAARRFLPDFPAYATLADKAGGGQLRALCVGVLAYLLLPILVIMPLSFSDSSFLVYPIPGVVVEVVSRTCSARPSGARREEQLHRRAGGHADRDRAGHAGAAVGLVRTNFRSRAADEPADRADGGAHRRRRRQHVPVLRAARAWPTATRRSSSCTPRSAHRSC
jgi:hypothetical protein